MTTTSGRDRLGIVLRWPAGRWLVAAAGAVVAIAGLYQLLYVYEGDHKRQLRLAKEIQLNMWSHFCVRVAALAGGRPRGGVTIRTRWVPWPPPAA